MDAFFALMSLYVLLTLHTLAYMTPADKVNPRAKQTLWAYKKMFHCKYCKVTQWREDLETAYFACVLWPRPKRNDARENIEEERTNQKDCVRLRNRTRHRP